MPPLNRGYAPLHLKDRSTMLSDRSCLGGLARFIRDQNSGVRDGVIGVLTFRRTRKWNSANMKWPFDNQPISSAEMGWTQFCVRRGLSDRGIGL